MHRGLMHGKRMLGRLMHENLILENLLLRRLLSMTGILVLTISLTGCGGSQTQDANGIDSVSLTQNQYIVCAKITDIQGNDMAITIAEKKEVDASTLKNGNHSRRTQGSDSKDSADTGGNASGGKASDGNTQDGGDMPDMGEMPGGGEMPDTGKMPGGGNMPDMGEMPSGDNMSGGAVQDGTSTDGNTLDGNMPDGETANENTEPIYTYEMTDETADYVIPVGAKVTTELGAVTTFSRLAVNDIIEMIVEKDTDGNDAIIGIWIEEQADE